MLATNKKALKYVTLGCQHAFWKFYDKLCHKFCCVVIIITSSANTLGTRDNCS